MPTMRVKARLKCSPPLNPLAQAIRLSFNSDSSISVLACSTRFRAHVPANALTRISDRETEGKSQTPANDTELVS